MEGWKAIFPTLEVGEEVQEIPASLLPGPEC